MEPPINILIVDDRASNRLALRALLTAPGYRLVEAESGPEALRCLLREQFAVLLLDVLMPEMSGFELAAAIRARPQTAAIPILFLTGEATEIEQIYTGYQLGAVDYLIKPLVPEMVRAKVAMFAELHRQRQCAEAQAALLFDAARKETELELLQLRLATERRFRGLADAVPHIVFTAGADGTVDYFNRRWFEFTGVSAEEAGGGWLCAVHPDDREAARTRWEQATRDGAPAEFECRLHGAAEAAYRWHLCRVVPEQGQHGGVDGWLGTFTDIEEQRRERAVLAEFKGTLDAVQDVVLIFDPGSWRILYASQGAIDTLGHSHEELLRMSPAEVMPDFDEAHLHSLLDSQQGADEVVRHETSYRTRDGGEIPVEVSMQRIQINGGRIVAIGRDISDRVRAQADRERLYEQAVTAVRLRDDFLSIASHELRTPLTALRLHIESLVRVLRRDAPAPTAAPEDRTFKKLEQAVRQVDRLTRLVDDLLDVSRITAGRLRIELDEIDFIALVREVLGRFESEAARVGCEVTLTAEGDLRGWWDPVRIEQIVVNLLSNALKFAAGKPIEISVWGDSESAHLVVRDHGIGIAPESQAKIFRRFERAAPESRFRGLGLGLYIVERIAAGHCGKVSVESELGVGSTFTVALPRKPPPAVDSPTLGSDE